MPDRGVPGVLHRAQDRSHASLLGGDDVVHRRAAAGGRGAVEGGVPRRRHCAWRGRRGGAGAEPGQRARASVARSRAVARAVPVYLAARPDAARVPVPAGGLYGQHHWVSVGHDAGRGVHDRRIARAGDHDRHSLREPDPRIRLPADRDGDAARADRRDPGGCRTLVAGLAGGRVRCRARPRSSAARARHQRASPTVDPPAVRHRAPAAAYADPARVAGRTVDAAAAGERGRRPDRRAQTRCRCTPPRIARADRGRS